MLHHFRTRILPIVLFGVAILGFWGCNVSDTPGTNIIRLRLDDSLSMEVGKYDWITVDVFDTAGAKKYTIFDEPYEKSADSVRLVNFMLPSTPPDPMVLVISVSKNKQLMWKYTIHFSKTIQTNKYTTYVGPPIVVDPPPVVEPPPIVDPIPIDTNVFKSLTITAPEPATIYVGESPVALAAAFLPTSPLSPTPPAIIWTVPAGALEAEIVNGNTIRGLNPGSIKVIATSNSIPALRDTLDVTVMPAKPGTKPPPQSIALHMPTPIKLAETDPAQPLLASVLPPEANDTVQWLSSNTAAAVITADNKVQPVKAGVTTITARSKTDASVDTTFTVSVFAVVKVESIALAPKSLTLYSGGADSQLTVVMTGPDTVGAQYSLTSSDPLVASVDGKSRVKGLKAGMAVITAKALGTEIADVCSVSVVTDRPEVAVSANQSIAFGGEAVFKVSVTQAYGSVVEIKADMDGDSVFESSVLGKDTATFKRNYTSINTVTVRFEVKDTEQNRVLVERKVVVGAPGAPLVSITSPSKDTTIRVDSLKIKFTVKDTTQNINATIDSTVKSLVEGKNTIRVSRKNAGGEGSDVLEVNVDRIGPAKPVFTAWTALQNPTTNNRPIWKWSAIPDAALYQVKVDDSDTSKGMINVTAATQYQPALGLPDGLRTLYLRAIDAAGNASAVASLEVTIKASPPAIPVVVETPVTPGALRSPLWRWRSGDATKGNGKYKVWLNGVEQSQASLPSYTGSALTDGTYILKVRELDDLGSESADLTFSEIRIDGTKPVITVSGRSSGDMISLTTTRAATVAGSIVEMGGSGLASATWELSGGTTRAATAIGTPGSFSINTGSMTNGSSTTLTIRAADGAKSAVVFTLVFSVNVPAPSIAFVSPTPVDGHISNGPITVYYQINSGPTLDTVLNFPAPASGETSTLIPLSLTASNEGGSNTITRTFYRTHASVRFFTATGTAGGDCSSWERACKFEGNLSLNLGKYFWLQSGQYDISGNPFNIPAVKIFGGIRANGKNILDRSGETVIKSTVSSTGRSYLPNGAELTKVTITGDFNEKVFLFDPGSLIKFVDCKFAAITANGANRYYGTLMSGTGVNLRFERCTFDNSAGNGALIVEGKEDPYYNSFSSCTFIPSSPASDFSNDFENGAANSAWLANRFYSPTGTPRMMLDGVCGLPGTSSCP